MIEKFGDIHATREKIAKVTSQETKKKKEISTNPLERMDEISNEKEK